MTSYNKGLMIILNWSAMVCLLKVSSTKELDLPKGHNWQYARYFEGGTYMIMMMTMMIIIIIIIITYGFYT